jgi:signal transduction histidine kinase
VGRSTLFHRRRIRTDSSSTTSLLCDAGCVSAVREVLETSPSVAVVATPAGAIVYANAAARTRWPDANTLAEIDWGDGIVVAQSELADGTQLHLASDVRDHLRDLEAFNSMVSHDLRAPLAVIQMSADLLGRDAAELPPRAAENIARIRRAVGNMSSLVEDLLALARVGHGVLQTVDVDISAMCAELVADLRRDGDEVKIADGITCRADRGLLRAALANLLSNAWKYSSRAPLSRVEIGVRDGALFVRDNGVGFDMAEAGKLFSPFERLHDPSVFPGTGVGLASVHRIVERHGGRIWAESAPGRGATFFVTLPGLIR